ncbi:MAG: radical SAM protein [Fibrobacter sp.]|nr:radical SAM protein [Fibrobacter sp.]
MAEGMFNTSGKFGKATQFGKWIGAIFSSGITARVFDTKPIWAQLKITERCNLNCGYCSEHKNDGCHVSAETVYKWIDHCACLGIKHLEFIGGEPLMHPDLFELIAYVKSKGINTGLTTNGFLLTREKAEKLIKLGIKRMQMSIDCIEPNSITKKSVSLLKSQLTLLSDMKIWVHVNSVIVKETIDEAYDLAKVLFKMGIPVAFSPAHDRGRLIVDSSNSTIVTFLNWLTMQKKNGSPVNMPQFLINYYIDTMMGKRVQWVCEGGCKSFYVDTNGYFKKCSHKESDIQLLDVNKAMIKENHNLLKGCEKNCGVSCMLLNSLPFCRLDYIMESELVSRIKKENTVREAKECTA